MDKIINIGDEDKKLCMLLEDEDIVDKLNEIGNTNFRIGKPFNKWDLEQVIESVKAYNCGKTCMVQLKNGKWIML